MATKKQIEANRRNAKLSTGPKTPEGKAAVAHNHLSHGLSSRDGVLPHEDRATFQALLAEFEARFAPADGVEASLVRQLVTAEWRLRRIVRIETGIFDRQIAKARDYEESPDERPNPHRTDKEAEYDEDTLFFGLSFLSCSGGEVFTTLSRYEAGIRRAFYKALHELERLRRDRPQPPAIEPPAADPPQPPQTTTPEPKLALKCENNSAHNGRAQNAHQSPRPAGRIPAPSNRDGA